MRLLALIFNPRLREGGDWGHNRPIAVVNVFNPRLREGGDKLTASWYNTSLLFSIHASAKEATQGYLRAVLPESFSIHASAKEATHGSACIERILDFQSTPPRRRRQVAGFDTRVEEIFNPRLREGGDKFLSATTQLEKIFQSTPPRRRRPQHIVIPQLSCAYLVSTTFLSTIFSFISQYIVLFPLFRVRMPCVFCVAYDSHYVPLFNIFYILFQGTPF